jgi:purine catabolism regulator
MRAAFVDELLAAEIADEQAWIQRGASLGFNLHLPHAAWIVEARGIPDWPVPLARFIDERNAHVPMSRREEGMLLFWPTSDPKSARDHKNLATELIARLLAAYPRARIQVGIGRPAKGPGAWFQTLQQARESWRLGKEFKGAQLTYFGDLGLYQLLTALGQNPEAARFYRKTLAKLIQYDTEKNAELVSTLEGFFACHGNLSQTAARLHIHRNTLTYRLEQIANITQLDLDDPDARFSLQLALKLRPVLR